MALKSNKLVYRLSPKKNHLVCHSFLTDYPRQLEQIQGKLSKKYRLSLSSVKASLIKIY